MYLSLWRALTFTFQATVFIGETMRDATGRKSLPRWPMREWLLCVHRQPNMIYGHVLIEVVPHSSLQDHPTARAPRGEEKGPLLDLTSM